MNVLPSAILIEAVQKMLPDGMFVSDFAMLGDLLLPMLHQDQGAVTTLQRSAAAAKEELSFNLPPHATANTICFFTDATRVKVSVKPYRSVSRLVS